MSQLLTHSPADVLRQALVDLGVAGDSSSITWPAAVGREPDRPDNCITVYDTAPRADSRSAIDGELSEHYGIQVRVRSSTYSAGWARAHALYNALCKTLNLQTVTLEGSTYLIECASEPRGPRPLRRPATEDRRVVFTMDCLLVAKQLS
jgi:hypothetical protein